MISSGEREIKRRTRKIFWRMVFGKPSILFWVGWRTVWEKAWLLALVNYYDTYYDDAFTPEENARIETKTQEYLARKRQQGEPHER